MGPVFVIGMLSGVLLAMPLGMVINDPGELSGSFSLLGMAGLMAAVVHAPLAALSAVMELSYSPEIILPAILVIVPAYVTSTQFLGNSSVFIRQLDYQKLPYTISPVIESLQKTGVLAVMDSEFKLFSDVEELHILQFLETSPTHSVVHRSSDEIDVEYSLVKYDISLGHDVSPLAFFNMQGVSAQATLAEVYALLHTGRDGAVYVYAGDTSNIQGVVTWNTLRTYLHKERY